MNLIIITNIVEIIKFFIIFSIMLKGKIYRSKRLWIGCLIVFAEVIFFSFCLKNDDFIISIIIFGSALSVMYNGNAKNKILLFMLAILLVNYVDTLCYGIMGILLHGNVWWYFIHSIQNIVIYGSIFVIAVLAAISVVYTKIVNKNWLVCQIQIFQCLLLNGAMIGLYAIIMIIPLFTVYGDIIIKSRLYILLTVSTVLTLSCILAFFLYSNHLKKENDLKTKNIEVQEENDGLRLALYANMEMMDDDMRQYRHDNRHHRAVLRELASKGDLEEIKDYLAQLSEQDEDLKKKNMLYTGNYMVDAIINGIIAKEAYSDVKFHCEGKLPRKLMIQDVDLSGLLSNGLENAAEACLHSNGDKCVLFKAAGYENMIHFEIKNTYDSTRYKALSKGDFETTKKDSEYHGYGIESMRRVVKKYDGKLEYIVEPEWVITDIYLQQKDEI